MQNENHNSFLELYRPLHLDLFRFCRALTRNREDAEDLVNDTVLAVHQSFDKIRDRNAFKSYLFSVAGNLNKMKVRSRKNVIALDESEMLHLTDSSMHPEYITEFNLIHSEILKLPAKTSEAIILFHILGFRLDEIRTIQGGSLSGIKLRLKRGREKLLDALNEPAIKKVITYFLNL